MFNSALWMAGVSGLGSVVVAVVFRTFSTFPGIVRPRPAALLVCAVLAALPSLSSLFLLFLRVCAAFLVFASTFAFAFA